MEACHSRTVLPTQNYCHILSEHLKITFHRHCICMPFLKYITFIECVHSLYIFFAVQYGQRSFDIVILVKKISIGQVQILKYGFSRICPLEIILNLHVYTLKSIDILSSIQIFLSRFM